MMKRIGKSSTFNYSYSYLNLFHVIVKLDSFFPRKIVKEEEFKSLAITMNVPYD
mgnify:FL=1